VYAFSDILWSLGHRVDPSSQMWMDICVADWLSSMDREFDVFSIYFIVRRGRTLILIGVIGITVLKTQYIASRYYFCSNRTRISHKLFSF